MRQPAGATSRRWLIVGAGGHARVVRELLLDIYGAELDTRYVVEGAISSPEEVSEETALASIVPTSVFVANGVGSTGSTSIRRRAFEKFANAGFEFPLLVSPRASVSASARLGSGTQVHAGSVVQTSSNLGDNVLVNSGALVEHDCTVRSHSHVASGSVLCGGVTLGVGVHVGAGATVVQGVGIEPNSVVGAGAVVTSHVASGATVVGVPARPLA